MTSSIPSSTAGVSTLTPIVDAALTEATGSVIGGGAPGPSGPVTSIPPFVQQYLAADPATVPSAAGGVVEQHERDNEAPSKKGGAGTGAAQSRLGHANTRIPDADIDNEQPSRKHGEHRRYRHLPVPLPVPLPPMKGGPITPPTAPPARCAPPVQGAPQAEDEPPMSPPPMKQPPMKQPPMKQPPMKLPPAKAVEAPAPVTVEPAPTRTYTTVSGDNLSQIAEKFDISWHQLYWANRDQIQNPDLIYAGQTLTVPPKDLQVPGFEYTPLFTPGIRSDTAGTGAITVSSPPAKAPDAPITTPEAPTKVEPAPPKDAKTNPTPDSPGTPPPPLPGSGQAPPAPSAGWNGLPPALP